MLALFGTKEFEKLLPKGSKIITPVSGFPTTVSPIVQLGYKPVFIDVELPSLNINLDLLEKHLEQEKKSKGPKSKAIMFAHVLGNPPNMNRLNTIANKYDLIILEDCCDALGSTYDGRQLGSFGTLSTCSFFPAHHITLGEGGFVATDNEAMYNKLRQLRD